MLLVVPVLFWACSSAPEVFVDPPLVAGPDAPLTVADVTAVVSRAAQAIGEDTISIAVVDREGNILAIFSRPGSSAATEERAVSLARTAGFFSNDQAPLSSRTVELISREHFPGNVMDRPSAALFGIESTNRGCDLTSAGAVPYNATKAVAPARNIPGTGPGIGITTRPGGVPLFRNGRLIGGVGVSGASDAANEFAAASGSAGFGPVVPDPGRIFLDGIQLPFVGITERPAASVSGSFPAPGGFRAGFAPALSPRVTSPFVPDGYLIGPRPGAALSAREVDRIVQNAVAQANTTRAAIRLPLGSTTRMVIAVAEGVDGASEGELLALFRMPDSTVFSIDVAATKARNVVYFSSAGRSEVDLPGVPVGMAVTNRTIGFGAQSMFPSGIDGSGPGPFRSLYLFDLVTPCSQGQDQYASFPPLNKSGVVFFPGSTPLYKNGVLVAGLGVSGDGVEQDDVVTEAGARGFLPDEMLRADRVEIGGVRLPYFKFNRNPEQL